MKTLFVALGWLVLSGCASGDADPTHTAVSEYLKTHAKDPASYAAVRWGEGQAFTRKDSAAIAARILSKEYDKMLTVTAYQYGKHNELITKALKLEAVTDTTRVGTLLLHAYRSKNNRGAVVLDSACFVVYENGEVTPSSCR